MPANIVTHNTLSYQYIYYSLFQATNPLRNTPAKYIAKDKKDKKDKGLEEEEEEEEGEDVESDDKKEKKDNKDNEKEEEINSTWLTSCACVHELENADVVVIAAPCYNFSIPAALKAYFDLVCVIQKT